MSNSQAGRRLARAATLASMGAAVLALPGAARDANACGGLFCNARPPDPFAPLPVAQNGENVVFSITKDPAGGAPTLVAHIQILYTGDAAKFSWVVPVDAAPMLGTGTDRLFTALAGVTTPSFRPSTVIEGTCIPQPLVPGSGGATGSGGSSGAAGASGAGGASGTGGGVNVAFQGAVGPYDAAVIQSDDPTMLKMWLSDNGYVVSDAAGALIDTYVSEHKFFVALKLMNGVGVRSIQPIVFTFRAVEPCVPLRLTAIAANPNMPVLVWVLGDRRVAPRQYFEIEIDQARIDWLGAGVNYFGPTGLVSQAANEAGGNAFVTEYAGPSNVARSTVYTNGQFNEAALRAAMTPPAYVQQIVSMGLGNDSLMLPLLAQYIPMPQAVKDMGITDQQFYGNIGTYWAQYAFPAYDLAGLTDAISMRIIQPRLQAQMMIDAHPYLTRLNTFISPEEMDKDAFFFETVDLPPVSNQHVAVFHTECGNLEYMVCNAPVRMQLEDGRSTWVRAGKKAMTCQGGAYDFSGLRDLPAATVAYEREATGPGTRVVDNTTMITAMLAANDSRIMSGGGPLGSGGSGGSQGSGGRGGSGGGGSGGGDSGGAAPGTGGSVGSGGSLGSLGSGGITADRAGIRSGGGGCGCTMVSGGPGGPLTTAVSIAIALLVVARRRRRY